MQKMLDFSDDALVGVFELRDGLSALLAAAS